MTALSTSAAGHDRRTAIDGRCVGLSRRQGLALLALFAALEPVRAAAPDARWSARSLPTVEPMRQLRPGGRSGLLGIGASGALWALSPAGGAPRRLAVGLDPATPLASGHGRIAARLADGGLWLWDGEREQHSAPQVLAAYAGLLCLPLAVIGVSAHAGAQQVVRLEPDGERGWTVVARSADPVLPDARPLLVDLDGSGDGGHVVVLAGPDRQRYDHGVLGDAVEATRLLWLERHNLQVLRELTLPAPQVFEDIAPRAVALARGSGLLSVRSGSAGAQLVLVTADAAHAARLQVAAVGDALGQPNRWLAPTTDGRRLFAVHTPHIGGVLHEYRLQGDRLLGLAVARDLSTHRIGSRELDLAVWLGSKLVVPGQDGLSLRVLDIAKAYAQTLSVALPARVAMTVALPAAQGMAALLDDGRVLSWRLP